MTDGSVRAGEPAGESAADFPVVPVFFLSDSTGISAETMGNALLIQFPHLRFERRLIPFISSVEDAEQVVRELDEAGEGPVTPLAFTTAATDEIRRVLHTSKVPIIDFFEMHIGRVESILGVQGARVAARLHGVGDVKRYNTRMQAVEYAIEHDDGQSLRALDKADVVLVAPSRCGKTPTTMYLALQHGLFVANYPLLDEDLAESDLPRPLRGMRERCFGITTTPARLSQVRQERRPGSKYASLEQCTYELRRAAALFRTHRVPMVDSSTKSVEEMAAVILQTLRAASRSLGSASLGTTSLSYLSGHPAGSNRTPRTGPKGGA
ncbi:MAG: pyruvate, water dikinase regulatory protein [Motilibacteraceae bacterium]